MLLVGASLSVSDIRFASYIAHEINAGSLRWKTAAVVSTGQIHGRSARGLERSPKANWTHRHYSAKAKQEEQGDTDRKVGSGGRC